MNSLKKTVTLVVLLTSVMGCSKYKVVDVEKQQKEQQEAILAIQKQNEEKIKEIQKQAEEQAKEAQRQAEEAAQKAQKAAEEAAAAATQTATAQVAASVSGASGTTAPEVKPEESKPATTQPTEVKPTEAKPEEAKPVETKPEVAAAGGAGVGGSAGTTAGTAGTGGKKEEPKKPTGWVKLYEHSGFYGRTLTLGFNRNVPNLRHVATSDGQYDITDKISSVQYSIPDGWRVILYVDDSYRGAQYVLKGKGSVSHLSGFNDKTSAVKWEKW